jgi:hypothetical protein
MPWRLLVGWNKRETRFKNGTALQRIEKHFSRFFYCSSPRSCVFITTGFGYGKFFTKSRKPYTVVTVSQRRLRLWQRFCPKINIQKDLIERSFARKYSDQHI